MPPPASRSSPSRPPTKKQNRTGQAETEEVVDRGAASTSTDDVNYTPSPSKEVPATRAPHDFCCSQCPRTFTRRENLSRHSKTHSAPWGHRCAICGKGFARSDLLSRHEAGHERWAEQGSGHQTSNISNSKRPRVSIEDNDDSPSSHAPDHSPGQQDVEPTDLALNAHHQNMPISRTPMAQGSHKGSAGFTPESTNMFSHSSPGFAETVQNLEPTQQPALYFTDTHFQGDNSYQQAPAQFVAGSGSNLMPFGIQGPLYHGDVDRMDEMSYGWFSNDFYSAMQETDETFGLEQMPAPMLVPFGHTDQGQQQQTVNQAYQLEPPIHMGQESNSSHDDENAAGSAGKNSGTESGGRVSRVASPPNEASEEDKWAFAWDPKSRAILSADPIRIPPEHPLWEQHNPGFDISEQTYQRVQRFITSKVEGMSRHSSLTLPTLQEANIFIGLYFQHFSPKMPVLHHPSLNTNEDLPPPLLGVIIVIGAIHSQLRGTRRFAIVLLDIVRWHLQVAIECDNSLMRDPKIIFAETLICYAGLWCGNKRAFELAEVVRATVVKQVRSAHFWRGDGSLQATGTPDSASRDSLKSQWLGWIQQESHRRLFWVIYALDAQFPSLLHLPAMFAVGEVCDLCCPCDEEFWSASTARHWKLLLGPALVPPTRVFSAAAAPFLWPQWSTSENSSSHPHTKQAFVASRLPVLRLNDWSAFLVLVTLQNQIFLFSQEQMFWNSCFGEESEADVEQDPRGLDSGPRYRRDNRRNNLKGALSSWQDAYLRSATKDDSHATSTHFRQSSFMGYVLALILLDVPFTEIHMTLGKNGKAGIAAAMPKLCRWMNEDPQITEDIVHTAIRTIEHLAANRFMVSAFEQSTIAMFLCYVLIWLFVNLASREKRLHLLSRFAHDAEIWKRPQLALIRRELGIEKDVIWSNSGGNSDRSSAELSWGVLRSAAQSLTEVGAWGAALNLALLLQRRSEI